MAERPPMRCPYWTAEEMSAVANFMDEQDAAIERLREAMWEIDDLVNDPNIYSKLWGTLSTIREIVNHAVIQERKDG